ncbi:hypothetical protein A3A67_04985 [Candidatus Peribacteria bacterium RIFCSPLOWO2_01_FULL_51_18]|nr:MAG: hypothetical protein A3C52_03680 [Candidatus Peribacteria bacterium RIFCSPHIGHO2_02_FULL_51_15]OGJ65525.1 MAG: hypothetical protein A3A67_04985 [Candidatus Peribacteria bacterium RIFCSPLOWO2_01_FULL_51_18]OGJ69381.1 MAG: hypothetical protein A3J34_04165 [Candidatus Peribacteria bacterium RIFCSPLOWO2_02_FULL_51_10]
MQKRCSNLWCQAAFGITRSDLDFYKSISNETETILPPDICPDCRSQLRCMHRNERNLYRRICGLCGGNVISMYSSAAPFPVYCSACFYGDKWDPLSFGVEYENSSFFDQLAKLYERVPRLAIMNKQSQNSDYCNYSYANKNCYQTSGSHYEEDCLYGAYSTKNKDCTDSLWIYGSELLYECMFSKNCYRSIYLDHCEDCRDCLFSRDLKGCSSCLFCSNLRQKRHCVFNEQKTKDEYERILASLKLDTYSGLEAARRAQNDELPRRFPVRALYHVQCENCEGDTLNNCKNMRSCYYCSDSEDCSYGLQLDGTYSSMDLDYMGYDRSERCYQTIGCLGLFDCLACNACWDGSGLRYSQYCFSCNDCFGCLSLKRQRNCILNKKYEQPAYEKLVSEIIGDLDQAGEWGSFFPTNLSPFGYNESMAQDWASLSQKVALEKGYKWKEDENISEVSKIIDAKSLPDSIDEIPDDILNWAIHCVSTGRPFRIVKKELEFYRKLRLPIPRIHPDERHRIRKALRNPRKLWNRNCAECRKPMSTSYSPERPEKVLCEECYLKEVY